jgi:2,4-dienoyl-CoA reductase-like NADH-dependent reductase (Old Yellow Enzyme family)/nucleotide-binding universal stress UspA family protein
MNDTAHTLFSPFALGPHVLKNRIVALPVFSGYAGPDGCVTRLLLDHYTQLAATGAAMVVVANTAVSANGRTSEHSLRADDDRYVPGLSRLATAIRDHGALACLQLNHAGQFARCDRPRLCAAPQSHHLRFRVAAFKALMEFFPFEERPGLTLRFLRQANTWRRGMTLSERTQVIHDFCTAAQRARRAGFDLIELHGANGYLISQYLSAFSNSSPVPGLPDARQRRTFPLELMRAVRRHLPSGFPVGFRLMLAEWVPQGVDLTEALGFAAELAAQGAAYLSPSAGTFNSIFRKDIRTRMHHSGYLAKEIAALADSVKTPVIAVGRVQTPAQAASLILETSAQLVGLGRALRTDPNWVRKARQPHPRIIGCTNCLFCLKQVTLEKGFSCARWPAARRRKIDLEHGLLKRNYRMVVLIPDARILQGLAAAAVRLWPVANPCETPLQLTLAGPETQAAALRQAERSFHKKLPPGSSVDLVTLDKPAQDSDMIEHLIAEGNHGMVLLARDANPSWQAHLSFRLRRRVLVLLGDHAGQDRLLAPVDLSDTTLLILTYLKHVILPKPALSVQLVHFSEEDSKSIQQRWRQMVRICGLARNRVSLEVVKARQPFWEQILTLARTRGCGAILMGKRGLPGIKRLVLGSVSAKVLGGLDRETLILVD